jgi:hypothetical protein
MPQQKQHSSTANSFTTNNNNNNNNRPKMDHINDTAVLFRRRQGNASTMTK